ncbi:MAG TPA: radical SAM protein [Candidatus Bathyarchaeia archaeon]|nr:radical SAM protein [Candidatus Bathyarchaeia archaeon]
MEMAGGFAIQNENLLNADEKSFNRVLEMARKISIENFGKKIRFYAPSFIYYKTEHYCSSASSFPSISITGSSCALKCKHCNGTVLNTMYPATTPKRLIALCRELKEKGAIGCLISGGCLPDGSVPLNKFANAIAQIKKELNLIIVVHTGIIDRESAESLKKAEVDAALIDVIGDDDTVHEIYRLNAKVADYEQSLTNLSSVGMHIVPHVLVGLHHGKLKGELQALEMIRKHEPSALIIISFMPIHGTEMEKVSPTRPMDVGKVILTARLMMPRTPLVLGCMTAKNRHKADIEELALRAGVNAMAFPSDATIKLAVLMGYQVSFSSTCCSQVYADIMHGF